MSTPAVTVLLPTTDDRASLVELSAATVLAQTVRDVELFVVGDGVAEASAERLERLAASEPRVRFFPFAKGERRGEPNRHHLLVHEARGRVVAYLTDRDLWLDHHLETVLEGLQEADFTHTLTLDVSPTGRIRIPRVLDLAHPRHRAYLSRYWEDDLGIPLSGAAHTLDAYRRLPDGWSTTPEGRLTDVWMWRKFLREPWVRARTCFRPTYLYFRRGDHPGPPVAERAAELRRWKERLDAERREGWRGFYEPAIADLYRTRHALYEALHATPQAFVRRNWHRIRWRLEPKRLLSRLRGRR